MTRLSVDDLTSQIDALLAEFDEMKKHSRFDDLSDLKGEDARTLAIRMRAAIERMAPMPTTYAKELDATLNDPQPHNRTTAMRLKVGVGILRALRADVNEGYIDGITELLHAQTFSDFLDQASELVRMGYKDPAAVLAGSALEAHIRLLCQRHGIDTVLPNDRPKTANAMNNDLANANVYNRVQATAISGWQAIRNKAAHGEYGEYSREQVAIMITSIRDFILSYPA